MAYYGGGPGGYYSPHPQRPSHQPSPPPIRQVYCCYCKNLNEYYSGTPQINCAFCRRLFSTNETPHQHLYTVAPPPSQQPSYGDSHHRPLAQSSPSVPVSHSSAPSSGPSSVSTGQLRRLPPGVGVGDLTSTHSADYKPSSHGGYSVAGHQASVPHGGSHIGSSSRPTGPQRVINDEASRRRADSAPGHPAQKASHSAYDSGSSLSPASGARDQRDHHSDYAGFQPSRVPPPQVGLSPSMGPQPAPTTPVFRPGEMHQAIRLGNERQVSELIRAGYPINELDQHKQSPLHLACVEGLSTSVDILLKAGALVNSQDKYGWSPLHEASSRFDFALCRRLLAEPGINVNVPNGNGNVPLAFLLRTKRGSVPEDVMQELLDLFLERNADLNHANEQHDTLLMLACVEGSAQLVNTLLKRGAKIDAKNIFGDTALHFAVRGGNTTVVQLLVNLKADPKLMNQYNQSPLTLAEESARLDLVDIMDPKQPIPIVVAAPSKPLPPKKPLPVAPASPATPAAPVGGGRAKLLPVGPKQSAPPAWCSPAERQSTLQPLVAIEDMYELGDELGRGAFAVVRRGRHRFTDEVVAVKVISKNKMSPDALKKLELEVEILKAVNHPHIISLKNFYQTEKFLYIVMECMEGGELFDRIVEKKVFSEADASGLLRNIISALEYLHKMGIVHRDLKPENLLLKSKDDDTNVKLADFGISRFFDDSARCATVCGTPGYIAPEILDLGEQGYGPGVDMWAIGIISYILLCGFPPFSAKPMAVMFRKILALDYSFPSPYWDEVSPNARDFIEHLLCKTDTRLSATEALKHPWLMVSSESSHGLKIMKALQKFKTVRQFERPV